ncbi:hypothetical protein C7C46_12315 [Streptomyces tateyamensis]|uniref:Uncharacterized protein n=1 Tax=Streptomyces tateyamensis TaxID=565073 RepID=A0A2V4NUS0_9ACTN|nr:hypothetical protein C7C46_12315 [Streptomyces tateyamensis]
MALLNWRDARHFDHTRDLPCRWCGRPTPLRDDQRRPSHKVCAEAQQTTPATTGDEPRAPVLDPDPQLRPQARRAPHPAPEPELPAVLW